MSGSNAPKQINSFESAGLNKFVQDNITKSKYTKPTPIQKVAIPTILAGRDLMACAQTGSGKTAAFLLPIINKLLEEPTDSNTGCPHVVIISPTRELTIQVYCLFGFYSWFQNLLKINQYFADLYGSEKICVQQFSEGSGSIRWHGNSISKRQCCGKFTFCLGIPLVL